MIPVQKHENKFSSNLKALHLNKSKVAGLLVPVFALRHQNDFGIGDTQAVREAIDFCCVHEFSILQILPIHECVGDYSPYNAISSQALSPALITISEGDVPGLSAEVLAEAAPEDWLSQLRIGNVKYNSVQPLKLQLILTAYQYFVTNPSSVLAAEFDSFCASQESWLPAYCLFRLLIREYEGNTNWKEWRPEHQNLPQAEAWFARHSHREDMAKLRGGFAFVQWIAWRQWKQVKEYAEKKGVLLMGEMSFGVSRCSVDLWQYPDLFDDQWSVGSPPTRYFDANKDSERWGQNWGLPSYRWENHRSSGFVWLRKRVQNERQFFHICRLDHLRGYFRAYMFPWHGGPKHTEFARLTEDEALIKTGGKLPRFVPGPDDDPHASKMNDLQGREIIKVIREAAEGMYLVGEIMGQLPDYMKQALDDLSIPSLTFPHLERKPDRSLIESKYYRPLSLVTYANHDHAPLAAYYQHLLEKSKKSEDTEAQTDLKNLLLMVDAPDPLPQTLTDDLHLKFISKLFETHCQLAILISSDLLGLTQRFNLPGSYGAETWSERLEFPLMSYATHPIYGPKISSIVTIIRKTGRAPFSEGNEFATISPSGK